MPELPEVETIKRGLETLLATTCRIKRVKIWQRHLRDAIPKDFAHKVAGQRIQGFRRRGKYLLWDLEKDVLLSHLGMSGTWRVLSEPRKHDHVYLHFEDGRILAYNDPRRFGILDHYPKNNEAKYFRFQHLGVEPLLQDFSGRYLLSKCHNRKVSIKNVIMDQNIVVGVGNIYACEALFAARISPQRSAQKCTSVQLADLVKAIKQVLKRAIKAGGSTINDFKQVEGNGGYFQHQFKVYGREGQACMDCGHNISNQRVGQRSSFYCSICQR